VNGLREIEPEAWDRVLDEARLQDIYARLPYLAASSILEPGRPGLLAVEEAGGTVVFPLLVRDIPGGHGMRDITTPYGYGGPLSSGPSPPRKVFDEAYQRWCDRMNVVTTFTRYHPLYANHTTVSSVELTQLSGVVGWRVERGRDLWASMHPHHRRLIRKAQAAGVRATIFEGPESLTGFRGLYEETMMRLDAQPFYFFDPEYWDALVQGLRPHLLLVESVLDERVVAAVLCLASAPWLHYHLGASDETGRATGASHLALFIAAQWAQERGYSLFNLGGGVGGEDDTLLKFKARFDPGGILPSFIGKQVNDPVAYRELSGSEEKGSFFPAYRARTRGSALDVEVHARDS
jgi:serine/alanine adding enzyme